MMPWVDQGWTAEDEAALAQDLLAFQKGWEAAKAEVEARRTEEEA